MSAIVLLAGILLLLYGAAAMFATDGAAGARRPRGDERRTAVLSLCAGAVLAVAGLVWFLAR